ncbi:MAG: hypothetical protein J6X51_07700 [Bacteroidales bacterium]|nr:hypothetical protein [Bacteroidales bacterium]
MGNNFIYNKLVRDENDFHGLVAYGLYKRHKIDYINQLKKEKNKDDVSDDELECFHLSSNTPSQLAAYHMQAANLLSETFIAEMQYQVDNEVKNIHKDIQKEIKAALPGWKSTMLISIVSSIIASVIIAIFVMFVSVKINFDNQKEYYHKKDQQMEQMQKQIEQIEKDIKVDNFSFNDIDKAK